MIDQFRTDEERTVVLSKTEVHHVLGVNPSYTSILKSHYFDNYDLPCPVLVEVTKVYEGSEKIVLRKTRHGNVAQEIIMLKALDEFGLPVPKVLAEAFENEAGELCAVYSLLPGENLQKLSGKSEEGLSLAKNLLIEAVQKLASTSSFISAREALKDLPKITLKQELENINSNGGEWLKHPLVISAISLLEVELERVSTPLILCNGDYQPGNFLAENVNLSGFLDFESPSFQDPMMGFVKYPIYDLKPLSRTDLIDTFLEEMGFTRREFAIRLVLGCLKILQKEIATEGGDGEMERYRNRVVGILREELEKVK